MLGNIGYNKKPIQPQYFLAKPNREIISKLSEIFNDSIQVKLNDVSELSFSVPYQLDIHHKLKPNKNADLIKERYLIKVVTGNKVEWFMINSLEDSLDDSDMLNVSCYSLVRELSDKLIKSYSVEAYGADQVIKDLLTLGNTIWDVEYIDPDFILTRRAFEYLSSTVLEAIYSVAEKYNAIVTFDTDKRTLRMTKPELTGNNRGLTISYGKLMKSMSRNKSSEEMVTRLSASGKDGLGIQKVNPTGQNYIENYAYWMNPFERDQNKNVISSSLYMSDSLCHALMDYEELVESKEGLFKQYLEELERYENELNTLNIDLNKLKNDEKVIQEVKVTQQFVDKMFFEKYSHSGSTSREFKLNKGYNYAAMIKVDSSSGVTVALNGSVKPVTSGRWVMLGKLNNLETTTITVNGPSTGVFMQIATISIEEYQLAGNDAAIVDRYNLDNKENQINLKQIEISNKLNQITNVQTRINGLHTLLDSDNNFTGEQLQELNYYMIEREFSDDVYIDEQDLYDATLERFKELQVPQLAVEIDVVNFLEIIEEQRKWDKLTLGDFVNVKYEPLGIDLTARISEIDYDFSDSSIKLTLSNATSVNDETKRIEKYLDNAKHASVVIDSKRRDWTKAVVDSSDMNKLFENIWNRVTNQINMSVNNTTTLDNTGLTMYDPDNPLRYLRLTAGAIGLTRSGGIRFETAIDADGVIAPMLYGKVILGSRVVIQDDTGVFTIEGAKLMIDDRCGRPVLRLGLTSEQPDVFGMHVNRYASSNCNDRTITNISGIDNSRGFYIDKIRNGVTSNVFWLAQDGNLRLRVGENNEVITVSEKGFGVGHENWDQALFRVDYQGNMWAQNAFIEKSTVKDSDLIGNRITLRDAGGVFKMWPSQGLWAGLISEGAEDFDKAAFSVDMEGNLKAHKAKFYGKAGELLIDTENGLVDFSGFDAIGIGALDAELLAANMLTVQDGIISNLTAGKLSTLTKAALQGWSNYVKIEGNAVRWLTGKVKSGSGTHKALSDGRKLYWVTSEQTGLMTVEVTPWPVMIYDMEDKEKAKFYFEGSGELAYPVINMGEGDGQGYGRGQITKPNGSFEFLYSASNNGRDRSLRLRDSGISLNSEAGEITMISKDMNVLSENGNIKIGNTSGSYIEIAQNGDININATRNVKINGTRIDLN